MINPSDELAKALDWIANGPHDANESYRGLFYQVQERARQALAAYRAPASPPSEDGLAADVVALVVAARHVAYEGPPDGEALRELDQAAEAFAGRVRWDDEPDERAAPPPTEPPASGEEEGDLEAAHVLFNAMRPPGHGPHSFATWAKWEDIKDQPEFIKDYVVGANALRQHFAATAHQPPSPTQPVGWAPDRDLIYRTICAFPLRTMRESPAGDYLGTGWCGNLADAIAKLPAGQSGWRDMASAPRDETPILVYFSGKTGRTEGVYRVAWIDMHGETDAKNGLWCVTDEKHGPYGLRGYCSGDDIGWMPLPAPPAADGGV